ncbi:unnamed protein product, partial [Pylaiella littoralis]
MPRQATRTSNRRKGVPTDATASGGANRGGKPAIRAPTRPARSPADLQANVSGRPPRHPKRCQAALSRATAPGSLRTSTRSSKDQSGESAAVAALLGLGEGNADNMREATSSPAQGRVSTRRISCPDGKFRHMNGTPDKEDRASAQAAAAAA